MPPIEIRVRASTQVGRFHRGPLHLTERWMPVDLARPDVRDALIASVGVHVAVHPSDHQLVEQAGLRLAGGRMVADKTPDAAGPPAVAADQDDDETPARARARTTPGRKGAVRAAATT